MSHAMREVADYTYHVVPDVPDKNRTGRLILIKYEFGSCSSRLSFIGKLKFESNEHHIVSIQVQVAIQGCVTMAELVFDQLSAT